MKKIFRLGLLIAAIVCLCACRKGNETPVHYLLSLDANPTTGYEWTYTMDKTGIVGIVRDEYVSDTTTEPVTGLGGTHYFVFEGIKPGTVIVTFTYARPWEEREMEMGSQTVVLTVDDALNVTENRSDM